MQRYNISRNGEFMPAKNGHAYMADDVDARIAELKESLYQAQRRSFIDCHIAYQGFSYGVGSQCGIDSLRRAIQETGWQQIETAPTGVSVLCYWPPLCRNDVKHEAYMGQAWHHFGNWFKTRDGYGAPTDCVNAPSHWMPLLAGPSAQTGDMK